jgi:hypothetical protein
MPPPNKTSPDYRTPSWRIPEPVGQRAGHGLTSEMVTRRQRPLSWRQRSPAPRAKRRSRACPPTSHQRVGKFCLSRSVVWPPGSGSV